MRLEQQNVVDLLRLLNDNAVRFERPIYTSDLDIYLEGGGMEPATILDLIRCHCGPYCFTVMEADDGAIVARIPGEGWVIGDLYS